MKVVTPQYPRILILTKEKKEKNCNEFAAALSFMKEDDKQLWRAMMLMFTRKEFGHSSKEEIKCSPNRILLFVEITHYIWLKSLFSLQCLETGIQMSNWFVNWTYEFLFLTTNESMRLGECLISSYELGTNSFLVRIKIITFHNCLLSSYMNVNGNQVPFVIKFLN